VYAVVVSSNEGGEVVEIFGFDGFVVVGDVACSLAIVQSIA